MQQLPLDIRLADHATFPNYLPTGNETPVRALAAVVAGAGRPVVWLWGPPGCGRSHLLQATVAAADQVGRRPAYLPLAIVADTGPALLEGLAGPGVVCLDDVERIAGRSDWERGLFTLYEQLRVGGGGLVLAAAGPPAGVGMRLPDLVSRLAAGLIYRLQLLDEDSLLAALTGRARFRGLELPETTARYLLQRLPRHQGDLFRLLDDLDRAALVAQRRLTVPFVRDFLGC